MYSACSLAYLQELKPSKDTMRKVFKVTLFLIAIILLISVIYQPIKTLHASRGEATYTHLVDGTFYYSDADANSKYTQIFQDLASKFLRIALPFMTVFGLTNIVYSFAATVIYLSNVDFFDEVHYQHYIRRKKKYERSSGTSRSMLALIEQIRQDGVGDSLVKGVLIPDFKARAFYDACEIGEDGRPSMATFFKYSFPKHVVVIALILMINDQTLLQLCFKGAEVGVFFFRKATEFDYVGQINRYLNMGSKYDPGYKGNKANVYGAMYEQLLNANQTSGTEKSAYRQSVGAQLANWMEAEMNQIDWDNYRVVAKASVDPIPLTNIPENTYQVPISRFGVSGPDGGEQYLTVRLTLESRAKNTPDETVVTTDAPAWTVSGDQVVLDLTKVSSAAPHADEIAEVTTIKINNNGSGVNLVDKSDPRRITFKVANPEKLKWFSVDGSFRVGAGGSIPKSFKAVYAQGGSSTLTNQNK